ncbi:uncharacterized protein LOC125039813 [Penaeus chinensis]|uniref:uncharacterized protein LOC125039813 n=1 Tax=Penaeus chinensis TaxID=139456 RepID=UPI001FB7A603|nr:uncharacterized protein LOC125039813 [Penaeus chinensis]
MLLGVAILAAAIVSFPPAARAEANVGVPIYTPTLTALPPTLGVLQEAIQHEARHFSTVDICGEAVCDQMVRQANGLARLKTIRRYIVEAISMMDSLVTALDAELVVAGETMTRALGNRCRAAHAVLNEVTKGPAEKDRLNGRSSAFIYGQDVFSRRS